MNTRIALGAGTLALLIGALGPWATFLGAINIGPTSSVEISIVVLGGVALVALSALTGRNMRLASISIGVLAVIETVYAIVRIQQVKAEADEWGALIAPGWGLYLTVIVGVFLIASTWLVRRPEPAVA
jgi:hypothetical protein